MVLGGTDIKKLQADVKKLATLIKNKFSGYLAKLDKPIEQAQFLTAMAAEIGVPLNKLSSIMSAYKDIATTTITPTQPTQPTPPIGVAESKVITKKDLIESLSLKESYKNN